MANLVVCSLLEIFIYMYLHRVVDIEFLAYMLITALIQSPACISSNAVLIFSNSCL